MDVGRKPNDLPTEIRVSHKKRLSAQKSYFDQRSAEAARALEILEKYPEIEELLTILDGGL